MKALGVRFALDDFGTGYSNFAFVLKIAPAYLKIDGSLIKNIIEDKNAYNVVQAIVAFAQEINAEVIAEYVENEQQVEALRACDVHLLQGYYFSIPSASFENRLNP
jgi:EAL domain-containing protein (putative c-di-GMP-specific phosphodiesterase class I)